MIGHRIDYNGVGVLRGQRHKHNKNSSNTFLMRFQEILHHDPWLARDRSLKLLVRVKTTPLVEVVLVPELLVLLL